MPTRIHYACKANANLAILRVLEQEGSCIDAVSIGEVDACLRAGFSPDRILYTGVERLQRGAARQLVQRKVPINIDSLLRAAAPGRRSPPAYRISFRVNPEVGAGHHEHVVTGQEDHQVRHPQGRRSSNAYAEAWQLRLQPLSVCTATSGRGCRRSAPFVEVTEVLVDIVQRDPRTSSA